MGFQIETAAVEVVGQMVFQEVAENVYLEAETGMVAVIDREGTSAILVRTS